MSTHTVRGLGTPIEAFVAFRRDEYTASTKRVAEMAFRELAKEFDAKVSAAGGLDPETRFEKLLGRLESRKQSLKTVLMDSKYSAVVFEKMTDFTFNQELIVLQLMEDVKPFVDEEVANLSVAFYQHCENVTKLYQQYFGNDEGEGSAVSEGEVEDGSVESGSEGFMKVEEIQTMASSLEFVSNPKYAFLIKNPLEQIQSTVKLVTDAYIRLEEERDALCAQLREGLPSENQNQALDLLRVTIRPGEARIGETARLKEALSKEEEQKPEPASRLSMTGMLVGGIAIGSLAAVALFGRDSLQAVLKKG